MHRPVQLQCTPTETDLTNLMNKPYSWGFLQYRQTSQYKYWTWSTMHIYHTLSLSSGPLQPKQWRQATQGQCQLSWTLLEFHQVQATQQLSPATSSRSRQCGQTAFCSWLVLLVNRTNTQQNYTQQVVYCLQQALQDTRTEQALWAIPPTGLCIYTQQSRYCELYMYLLYD